MKQPIETIGGLAERLARVRTRLNDAAVRCNRSPDEITLIAISKTHPPDLIKEILAHGVRDVGENRVQEAEEKIKQVGRDQVRWHLVGHLQANKARRAVNLFDVVHSLDSLSLARRLDRLCEEEGRERISVLIQVDLGQEETKSGAAVSELPAIVEGFAQLSRLKLIGLMTLPPFFEDPESARPFFQRLRELRNNLSGAFVGKGELSMGMTHDFEVAIQEGATMVRIGTAIFGERVGKI